jgi:hypothetical protein
MFLRRPAAPGALQRPSGARPSLLQLHQRPGTRTTTTPRQVAARVHQRPGTRTTTTPRQVAARVLMEPQRAEVASSPATLRPAVFSAKRYVRDFLEEPLMAAFPESRFFEVCGAAGRGVLRRLS